MKSMSILALGALGLTLAGCNSSAPSGAAVAPAAPAPITEAEAAKIADATIAAWTSMDGARIKALYAPTIVGFDYAAGPLAADKAAWDKNQDGYAAAKIDRATQKERVIQILDADTFVVSGSWNISSSTTSASLSARCTIVYEKDDAGAWPIINEHCSAVPPPA